MVRGIVLAVNARGRDHMGRQEAREIQGPGLLFYCTFEEISWDPARTTLIPSEDVNPMT